MDDDGFMIESWMGPVFTVVVVAATALMGIWSGVNVLSLWKWRRPSKLVPQLVLGFALGVAIPVTVFVVNPFQQELPEPLAEALAWLVFASVSVWAIGFCSVMYRAVSEWWWDRRDKKHGDVWSIETLPDGSTKVHPPRLPKTR
ncbi:Uncharacterised protein [Mycobacteroides abscessus subsp. abscessus]|uniref:hypothetical protein n=1 Tax=Mycobacteroides abscessus TaxID=36809 RepID=UPI0009298835|nr:hypothetical protein [Mycobacteroides abscessus]SHU68398.1 Uncharacterised protein [Mycobacteroides abscessus subsp. abscessus]